MQILSLVAQNERENIKKRQAQGIAAAKQRGVRFGRPETPLPDDFDLIIEKWNKGEISIADALSLCDMSESTFYRKRKKIGIKNEISVKK